MSEGPVWSVYSQLGLQGFPLTRPEPYFLTAGRGVMGV